MSVGKVGTYQGCTDDVLGAAAKQPCTFHDEVDAHRNLASQTGPPDPHVSPHDAGDGTSGQKDAKEAIKSE